MFVYVDKEVEYIEETNAFVDYIHKDKILKHSKNIIDLIEVGDLIKYEELSNISYYFGTRCGENYVYDIHDEKELQNVKKEMQENNIKLISIVTREQFKQVEYEV